MRSAKSERITAETRIEIALSVDGTGRYSVECPIGFLKHMLETFARHAGFDLEAKIAGDLSVDQHHTVEDAGRALGDVLRRALGDKSGIRRAGSFLFPMDESLARAAVDLSGRPFLKWDVKLRARKCGDLETNVVEDFFAGFAEELGAGLHLKVFYGRSDHHKLEAVFKAAARALREACAPDSQMSGVVPSTKEVL